MAKGKQTIFVGPADDANHKPLTVEGLATVAVTPGSAVNQVANGFELSTTANGDFQKTFLVANIDEARSRTVADDWALNQSMVAIQPRSGEFFNALVITGQAITIGDALTRSATGGALQLAAGDNTDDIVGYADETVTTTATQLVRVRKA